MKKIFMQFFIVFMMISTVAYAGNLVKKVYFSPYPILIDGEGYSSEMPILQYQERTYVALREFSEMVGVNVGFKDEVITIETKEYGISDFEKIEKPKEDIKNDEKLNDKKLENSVSSSNSKIVYVYKWNCAYVGSDVRWFKWSSVKRPSFVMIAGDSTGYHISPSNSGNGAGGVGPVGSNFIRHGGEINAVFIDGHVEALPLGLMPGIWSDSGRKTKPYL